jgi:hypothetical protein
LFIHSKQREANLKSKRGNLLRLRGVSEISAATGETNAPTDYVTYLIEKYSVMRVLIDTNVILDFLQERELFVENAARLFERIDAGEIQGFIASTTITNISG